MCDVWKGTGTVVLMMVTCVNCRWDSSGGECYRCRKEGRPLITPIVLRDLVYDPQMNIATKCEGEDRGAQTWGSSQIFIYLKVSSAIDCHRPSLS